MMAMRLPAATALLAAAFAATADEAAVRRLAQEQMRRGATIESVRKAPWGDLYEVVVRATPIWFLESGERYSGALPLDEIRRLLDEASPGKR